MRDSEFKRRLEEHKHWLLQDCEGWEEKRACFAYEDFTGAYFSGLDLKGVDFEGANLSKAILRKSNLNGANFSKAILRGADLSDAVLSEVDFDHADLEGANLSNTVLSGVNFNRADLIGVQLTKSFISEVDFGYANLQLADLGFAKISNSIFLNTNLRCADFYGAKISNSDFNLAIIDSTEFGCVKFTDIKNMPYIPMICPEEGEFIGWKKSSGKIVKLLIPEEALRLSNNTRKCRCNKATVLAIYEIDGTVAKESSVSSNSDCNFIYEVGKVVEVADFNTDRWAGSANGIHFFINRMEAVKDL